MVNEVEIWCLECERSYVSQEGAECPICPTRRKRWEVEQDLFAVRPFQIVQTPNPFLAEKRMNDLTAEGWELVTFTSGFRDGGNGPGETGETELIALFKREEYNRLHHGSLVEKRESIEREWRALAYKMNQRVVTHREQLAITP